MPRAGPGLVDPFTSAGRATGGPTTNDVNTCAWGSATTQECPHIHGARNGHSHPQIYFVDHTPDAWPVDAAVPVWNEAEGVDSWYRWANCPFYAGTHCVGVYADYYGNTGWVGLTNHNFNSTTREFYDNQVTVYLNRTYEAQISAARRRKSTCHELGHALGLGHNSNANSCLISGNYTSARPNGDDFALVADIYRSF